MVIERPPKFGKNQSYIFVDEIEAVSDVREEIFNESNSSVDESSLDEFAPDLEVEEESK